MNRLVVSWCSPLRRAVVTGRSGSPTSTKQNAERKQLGLDANALRSKYPTPEVTFSGSGSGGGGAQCVQLCPGKTGKFALKGKFSSGSLFLVESNDVEVVEEQQTAGGWEATVKAKPDASRRGFAVSVTAPVSSIQVRPRPGESAASTPSPST